MKSYFALFLIATIAALVITPLVRRLCERFKLLDVPTDGRRIHKFGIPRLGGVAIYFSMGLALATLPLVSNFITDSLRTYYTGDILIALVPSTLVLLLGVYDDLRGANATAKFICLGLIASLFYWMGGRIEILAIPFLGAVYLPPVVGFLVTVFWLVGIANAFNLIDGMDGLAPGAALFSSMVILAISMPQHNHLMIVVSLVLCGALAGFLRYNFNPASIFMGDSGALFVGFLLAALAVLGTQKATTAVAVLTPILAFGLPVVDTGVTMARRLVGGRPIFQGDSEHIHHMLLARGWSQRRVVLILYAVCAVFGLLAALFTKTSSPQTGLVLFVIAVAVVLGVGHLRYHELDELRAGMKRTVGDRRTRVANNIRLRRASLSLSQASTLNELIEAVGLFLEFGDFASANLHLGQAGHAEVNERVCQQLEKRRGGGSVEFREGRIIWSWQQPGVAEDTVEDSSKFWCFQLPLATGDGDWGWMKFYRPVDGPPLLLNMNYLTGTFRRELAAATERVFKSPRGFSGDQPDFFKRNRGKDRGLMPESTRGRLTTAVAPPVLSSRLRGADVLGSIIFGLLLALIVFTAIPFGTAEPWWKAFFVSAVFTISILWLLEGSLRQAWFNNLNGIQGILLPILALALFSFLQTVQFGISNKSGEQPPPKIPSARIPIKRGSSWFRFWPWEWPECSSIDMPRPRGDGARSSMS